MAREPGPEDLRIRGAELLHMRPPVTGRDYLGVKSVQSPLQSSPFHSGPRFTFRFRSRAIPLAPGSLDICCFDCLSVYFDDYYRVQSLKL